MPSLINPALKMLVDQTARQRSRDRSAQHYQLAFWIGRVVIAFNEVDDGLAQAVASELKTQEKELGEMLLASMSYGQRLDLFAALLLKRYADDDGQRDRVKSVVAALAKAEEFRNVVVHSVWLEPGFLGNSFTRKKSKTKGRKGLRTDREAANASILKSAVAEFETLSSFAFRSAVNPRFAPKLGKECFEQMTVKLSEMLVPAKPGSPSPSFSPRFTFGSHK